MKKQNLMFLLLFFFFIVGCSNYSTSGSPNDTMKGFIQKIKLLDFEGAKKFTTNNTDATLDFLSTRIQILKDMRKEDQISTLLGGVDFTKVKVNCVTNGLRATCTCCHENNEKCKDISVVQEGGKWLINIPKETKSDN